MGKLLPKVLYGFLALILIGVFSTPFSIPEAESAAHINGNGIDPSSIPEVYVTTAGPTAVSTDGTWFEFSTSGITITQGCSPADPTAITCVASTGTPTTFVGPPAWTFTCPSGGCALTVTDAFLNGDQFNVFDNTILIGTTSIPGIGGACGPNSTDPEDCLLDPNSSSGVFPLGPGAHSITIFETTGTFGAGAHYFKVQLPIVVGGTNVSIDTSALLLAGVQSISMWMIPVVIAGVGIGVFVIKRRN